MKFSIALFHHPKTYDKAAPAPPDFLELAKEIEPILAEAMAADDGFAVIAKWLEESGYGVPAGPSEICYWEFCKKGLTKCVCKAQEVRFMTGDKETFATLELREQDDCCENGTSLADYLQSFEQYDADASVAENASSLDEDDVLIPANGAVVYDGLQVEVLLTEAAAESRNTGRLVDATRAFVEACGLAFESIDGATDAGACRFRARGLDRAGRLWRGKEVIDRTVSGESTQGISEDLVRAAERLVAVLNRTHGEVRMGGLFRLGATERGRPRSRGTAPQDDSEC
ncbi:MAG: hypothetical protein AAF682_15010 [Planctomycetota bacterium]